jgi:hypothetical protein
VDLTLLALPIITWGYPYSSVYSINMSKTLQSTETNDKSIYTAKNTPENALFVPRHSTYPSIPPRTAPYSIIHTSVQRIFKHIRVYKYCPSTDHSSYSTSSAASTNTWKTLFIHFSSDKIVALTTRIKYAPHTTVLVRKHSPPALTFSYTSFVR